MITEKQLFEDHPVLLSNVYCGFTIKNGWMNLVNDLCNSIEVYCRDSDIPLPGVAQVKEKFGLLRFYIEEHDNEIQKIIWEFEARSRSICDICGGFGKLIGTGWLKTRCGEHEKV